MNVRSSVFMVIVSLGTAMAIGPIAEGKPDAWFVRLSILADDSATTGNHETLPQLLSPSRFDASSFRTTSAKLERQSDCVQCWVYFFGDFGTREDVYGSGVGNDCYLGRPEAAATGSWTIAGNKPNVGVSPKWPLVGRATNPVWLDSGARISAALSAENSIDALVVSELVVTLMRKAVAVEDTVCAYCPDDNLWESAGGEWMSQSGCHGGEFISQYWTPCDDFRCMETPSSLESDLRDAVKRADPLAIGKMLRKWSSYVGLDRASSSLYMHSCSGEQTERIQLPVGLTSAISSGFHSNGDEL